MWNKDFDWLNGLCFSLMVQLTGLRRFARKTGWEPSKRRKVDGKLAKVACVNRDTFSSKFSCLSGSTTRTSIAVLKT